MTKPAARAPGPEPAPWPALGALDLDDLVEELRARAASARAAQERMSQLLDAVVAVSSDLELADVLTRIVASACALVGARYGALGVLDAEREHLAEFITEGVTPQERTLIGDPPHGNGILGLLITDPRPVRLPDIASHPASYGFPPNHPPMHSFLGTPIRARDAVFGNLYLAEKSDGTQFTEQDESIVVALAAAAGVAVDNARLYADGQRRARWTLALTEVTHALLEGQDDAAALRLLTERAVSLAGVRFAAVALSDEGGDLVVRESTGANGHDRVCGTALSGEPWTSLRVGRTPVLLPAPRADATAPALLRMLVELADGTTEVGVPDVPGAVIPLTTGGDDLGVVLVLWDGSTGAEPVAAMSELTDFVQHAGLALLAGRAQHDRSRIALLDDRQRIGRDMHDHVIQRLFATGLSLQAASQSLPGAAGPGHADERGTAARVRLEEAVDELDAVIREIRMTIFELNSPPTQTRDQQLDRLVGVFGRDLGFAPVLRVTGILESVPDAVWTDAVAVVREGLSNALRHARATAVGVEVVASTSHQQPSGTTALEVEIWDDGVGTSTTAASSGLVNLGHRAARHDGRFVIEPFAPASDLAPAMGTRLRWLVPLATRPVPENGHDLTGPAPVGQRPSRRFGGTW